MNESINNGDEVILHLGSNDISEESSTKSIVANIDNTCKQLKQKKPSLRISVSSIFLQTYNSPLTINIIEANKALRRFCLTQGHDFISHGNIAFKYLLPDSMYLSPDGYRLFAKNILEHVKLG